MYYEKVFKSLNKHKVQYLVVGGIAVNLYGVTRLTMDLDLMVATTKDNFKKLFSAMEEIDYKPNKAFNLEDFQFKEKKVKITDWGGIIIVFYNPKDEFERIDVFLDNPMDFDEAYKCREIRRIKDTQVSLISFDDLIRLKKKANRDKDLRDIGYLRKFRELENEKKQ